MHFGYEKEDWEGLRPFEWMHKNHERFFFPFSDIRAAKAPADLNSVLNLDSGIYFLFCGDNLEYVGQAKSFYPRLSQHLYPNRPSLNKTPWITHWSYIWVPHLLLNDIEYFYLDILKPPRNTKFMGYEGELKRYRQVVIG